MSFIISLLCIFYSSYDQTASISKRHVNSIEYEIRKDPFHLHCAKGPDDLYHASNGHQGDRDLRNATKGTAQKLRNLIHERVPIKIYGAEEDIADECCWEKIRQKVR